MPYVLDDSSSLVARYNSLHVQSTTRNLHSAKTYTWQEQEWPYNDTGKLAKITHRAA